MHFGALGESLQKHNITFKYVNIAWEIFNEFTVFFVTVTLLVRRNASLAI